MKATPEELLGDMETLGLLFGALCERDLKIYAESFGANLYHYQDYAGWEIDAAIELSDGSWRDIEIKPGANQFDAAAANLIKIRDEIARDERASPRRSLCPLRAYKRGVSPGGWCFCRAGYGVGGLKNSRDTGNNLPMPLPFCFV